MIYLDIAKIVFPKKNYKEKFNKNYKNNVKACIALPTDIYFL